MSTNLNHKIYSSRALNAPLELVYEAFANPQYLQQWWGPEGFTNTIHEFDLRPGGKWLLTMHGPDKGHYENSSIFQEVIPNKSVSWTRLSQPLFDMQITFELLSEFSSKITFVMTFSSVEECEKMKKYVVPKNEENFDRLERLLKDIIVGTNS